MIFILGVLVIGGYFYYKTGPNYTAPTTLSTSSKVILKEKTFFVEIADTDQRRALGLSGHAPLSENQGMLFIFDTPAVYEFWMKDMKFALDIIWIDENMKIVYIQKSAQPESYPEVFNPRVKSLYVLEVLAGQADALKIGVGDTLKIVKN